MTRNLTTIFFLCLAFAAYTQSHLPQPIDGLTIDPGIKKQYVRMLNIITY